VNAAVYHVTLLEPVEPTNIQQQIEQIFSSSQIMRTRRDKPYDLRPLIQSLALMPSPDQPTLEMTLSAREGATGRPEEVLSAMEIDPFSARIHRTQLILSA